MGRLCGSCLRTYLAYKGVRSGHENRDAPFGEAFRFPTRPHTRRHGQMPLGHAQAFEQVTSTFSELAVAEAATGGPPSACGAPTHDQVRN